jgi:hypothetical protein
MKFDNQDTVYGIHSLKLVLAVVVVVIILLMYLTSIPDFIENQLGISQNWVIAIIVLLYLMFFGYFIWMDAAFVSYNDEGNKLVIRTFKLRPWGGKKISMEIPHSEFYKYEIVSRWPKKQLHIWVKKGNQIMKYPPVSVVSLTAEQFQNMVNSLKQLSKV